ncbi:MAG TPA: hypothetical protein VK116_05760, partial [Planctomycetota bacterium]|nr:hypothetical protein [Planctomycetota bacterium]
ARPELDRSGGSGGDLQSNLIDEGKKNLEEIQRLLDEVRGRLSEKDTGAETQTKQTEASQKLQKLIEKLIEAAQQQQQQGGGGGGQQRKPSGQQSGSEEQSSGEKEDESESRRNQEQVSGSKPQDGDQQEEQTEQEKSSQGPEQNDGQVENDRTGNANPEKSGAAKAIEDLKRSKRWGMLPPKLREEMTSAAGRDAPREYREMIELYYKRLSEHYTRPRR